jgi:hypothetical protein
MPEDAGKAGGSSPKYAPNNPPGPTAPQYSSTRSGTGSDWSRDPTLGRHHRGCWSAQQQLPLALGPNRPRPQAFGLRLPSSAAAPRCAGFGSIRSAAGCPQGPLTDGSSIATHPWPPRPGSTAGPQCLSPARFNPLGVRKGIWRTHRLN